MVKKRNMPTTSWEAATALSVSLQKKTLIYGPESSGLIARIEVKLAILNFSGKPSRVTYF